MLPRTYLLFLVGLVTIGAVGCATLPGFPLGIIGEAGPARAEANAPKRQPRASTCVAYGELHERAATDPGRSPVEQEELRNKARLAYQQALQIHPNDLPALNGLARLYISEGDDERAVAVYNQAIQAYPKDAALRHDLGMCHTRRKNWDLALQSLQIAVRLDPENRRYGHFYGLCLARAQRYDESFAVLAKLDGPANAHYELARMLHHLKEDEASKEHLRLALAQNPELIPAQRLLVELETARPDPSNLLAPDGPEHSGSNAAQAVGDNQNEHSQPPGAAAGQTPQFAPLPEKGENR